METKPKHKRVLHSTTPRGLPRWLRAADNAVRKPNSLGAKLYYRRVANAQRLREQIGDGEPVVFFPYQWNKSRRELACSFFCAAMHAQLTFLSEFNTVDRLIEFLETDERCDLLSNAGIRLKRSVKCVVCGTPVKN